MIYRSLFNRMLVLLSLLVFSQTLMAQEAVVDIEAGKALFRNNCASCHNKNMKDDMTGPALGGVEERWADYPREDLYSWINNSQKMINDGHPRAKELWADWSPVVMNNFNLSPDEIENIIGYINDVINNPKVVGGVGTSTTGGEVAATDYTSWYIVLAVILGLLALVLARILSNLNYMVQVREGNAPARRQTIAEMLTSKGVIAFVLFALVVLGGYTTVNNAISLGRQQGYQPEQPIKFSHATHAGLQKIDCQYCHDGARRSKHSVIPAANTCMNCHKAIKVGSQYGTAELTKIYASIGYDPTSDKYIDNYESLSQEEVSRIYKSWISNTHIKSGEAGDAEEVANDQWDAIVEALTDPTVGDNTVQGPIEWVRIHNLPDHAYFNHAQHVSVGKVECQTCHGQVEEMELVAQHAPLSMGWCINCHRQTEVQFADNDYYKSYENYHKEIANGERDKVTVEDIGGLECQKCHY